MAEAFDIFSALLGDVTALLSLVPPSVPDSETTYNTVQFVIGQNGGGPIGGIFGYQYNGADAGELTSGPPSTGEDCGPVINFSDAQAGVSYYLNQNQGTNNDDLAEAQMLQIGGWGQPGACISGIIVTTEEHSSYGFSADTWAACGYPTGKGGTQFGTYANGTANIPYCMILMADTPGQFGSVRINLAAFSSYSAGATPTSTPPASELCSYITPFSTAAAYSSCQNPPPATGCVDCIPKRTAAPEMRGYPPKVQLLKEKYFDRAPRKTDTPQPLEKRDTTIYPGHTTNETRFFMDTSTDRALGQFCNITNSYGPDIMNFAQNKFCNMTDRTLWNICPVPKSGVCISDCFKWDGNLTLSWYEKGKITKNVTTYTEMIRAPYGDTSSLSYCGK